MKSVYYLILALALFFIGVLFYYFFREPTIVHQWLGIKNNFIYWSSLKYFNWFPSFVHVFTFSILTWLILDKKYDNQIILFWTFLNLLSEYLQNFDLSYFEFLPNYMVSFYLNSTFSLIDMLAIIFAGLLLKLFFNYDKKSNSESVV